MWFWYVCCSDAQSDRVLLLLCPSSAQACLDSAKACNKATVVQVVELMAEEKGWWYWKRQRELKRARAFLQTFTSDAAAPGKKSAARQDGTDLISSHNKGGGA